MATATETRGFLTGGRGAPTSCVAIALVEEVEVVEVEVVEVEVVEVEVVEVEVATDARFLVLETGA